MYSIYNILEYLKDYEKAVSITIYCSTIDDYGNKGEEKVIESYFSKETIDKYNFEDNQDMGYSIYMKFPKTADVFWMVDGMDEYLE